MNLNKKVDIEQLPIWNDILNSVYNNDLNIILRGYIPFGKVTFNEKKYAYINGANSIHLIIQSLLLLLEKKTVSNDDINNELLIMVQDFDFSLLALQYVSNSYMYYSESLFKPDFKNILETFINCNYEFKDDEIFRLKNRLIDYISKIKRN